MLFIILLTREVNFFSIILHNIRFLKEMQKISIISLNMILFRTFVYEVNDFKWIF